MKRTKRFAEGGFSAEQEKWLGGADRTDPYILARMRKAVPDALPPVEDRKATPVADIKPAAEAEVAAAKVAARDFGEIRDEEGTLSKLRRNTETGELYDPTGSGSSTASSASRPAATRSAASAKSAPAKVSAASKVTDTGDETARLAARYPKSNGHSKATQKAIDDYAARSADNEAKTGEEKRGMARELSSLEGRYPADAETRRATLRDKAEKQALEQVHPEEYLVGSALPGIKAVASAARSLATRTGSSNARAALLEAPAKRLTGPSKADLLARDRAGRAATRQDQMLKDNADNYGLNPSAPGYEAAADTVRKNLGGKDFSVLKRGGAVKKMASGGSASRRADGIAQRGKTRGKMC